MLRHLVDAVSTEHGVVWLGAIELASRLGRTERRARQLLAEARADGWIQRVHVGGGRHRTSHYALKIGAWRDDPRDSHPSATFATRTKAGSAAGLAWLQQLYCDHLALGKSCCLVFAPRELKNPEISWVEGSA